MEKSNSKRNKLTSAIAVVLAAVMLIGGASYAYLEDSDGDVVNTFSTNEIDVEIDETTGEDYDIVPGTSQEKDPTVTIENTVDAYLYVIVDDQTQGLVDYTIADGWTLLDGYDNVYYRVVGADDTDKVFSILEGDTVYYSADLTNADMQAVTDDITLTFSTYAIQVEPFNDPVKAYTQETVSTATALEAAIEEGVAVTLSDDVEIASTVLTNAEDETLIYLDNNTLTITGTAVSADDLTIANGDVVYAGTNSVGFSVGEDASLTLENVDYTHTQGSNSGSAAILVPAGTDTATVNVIDSTITTTAYYGIGTNAGSPTGDDVVINIENSTVTVAETCDSYSDSCGVLFNINGTLNITDSTITAERQGVIVRQGTANITNSTLVSTGEYTGGALYLTGRWKSGNEVPMAALVAGDNATSYTNAVVVNLSNVTLTAGGDAAQLCVGANDGVTTTVNTDTTYDNTVVISDGTTYSIG